MIKWLEFQLWFKRELKHGELIPRGFGWAGFDVKTERVYAMPLPFNFIWSLLVWLYTEVWEGVQSQRSRSYTYKVGLQLGQFNGYKNGYMAGYTDHRNGKPNKLYPQEDAKP
jgi:hypothetical protein